MNFGSITDEIVRRLKDDTDEALLAIKLAVNMSYQEAWAIANWWFARRRGTLQLIAPYTTGTITVTKDGTTITGSGTTFTAAMIGRKLKVGQDPIIYKISAFTSTTEVTIETGYKGSSGAGKAYGIYADTYTLADRATRILQMWQTITPAQIYEWDQRSMHEIRPSPSEVGLPRMYALIGQTVDAYYSTGTVAVSADERGIVGTGTAWTSAMVGRLIKIYGNDDEYVISAVTDTTHLTLDAGCTLSTGDTLSYEISPPGIEQVQLWRLPDRAMQVEYTYILRALKLLATTNVPELPQQWHHILVLGGYYRVLPEREISLGLIKMAREDYYGAIAEMKRWHYASEDKLPEFKHNFRTRTVQDDDWWRLEE